MASLPLRFAISTGCEPPPFSWTNCPTNNDVSDKVARTYFHDKRYNTEHSNRVGGDVSRRRNRALYLSANLAMITRRRELSREVGHGGL